MLLAKISRLSLIYAHITNLMHIPQRKKKKQKKKTLLYSTPYILIYYYFKPISSPPTLRPMNYLQLGFNQLTKTTRDRWQINYYLKGDFLFFSVLGPIKYNFLNRSVWLIDVTLTDAELNWEYYQWRGTPHPHISRTGASQAYAYPGHPFFWRV